MPSECRLLRGSVTLPSTPERPAHDRSGELDPAILLVDMDSFFASVEVRDDPSLAGKPILVGGDGLRGVVASCTYEARRYGIHSAMPMVTAKRMCPQAIVLPGNMSKYLAVSRQIHEIFRDTTPIVEPLGLDEAFLDVTGAKSLLGTPLEMAAGIRARIADELELGSSVGVGDSKLIAKLACREAKPRIGPQGISPGAGTCVILPEDVAIFLDPLPVSALFGVGPSTAKTLSRLGIERVSELAALDPEVLVNHLGGAHAHALVGLARGEDPRPVVADAVSKSIGHEETFAVDVEDREVLDERLRRHAVSVAGALRSADRRGRTITVKVKLADFTLRTRSHTMLSGLDDHVAIFTVARSLLASLDVSMGVRLLGLSASGLEDASVPVQLTLGMEGGDDVSAAAGASAESLQQDRAALEDAIVEIRSRFGRTALGSAAMLRSTGLEVPAQRQAPFGPTNPV